MVCWVPQVSHLKCHHASEFSAGRGNEFEGVKAKYSLRNERDCSVCREILVHCIGLT